MALNHAHPGEMIDVRPLGKERFATQKSVALFKSDALELIRLVLLAGKSMPLHKVNGPITIHCIEGCLDVFGQGHKRRLHGGQLLYLLGGVEHGLTALEDSSALVTIVLKKA